MKLVTWNINSIRSRWDRLAAFLQREAPDVVCLQETKAMDDAFPTAELAQLGYSAVTWGQKTYNGVALLSRSPIEDVTRSFPDNTLPDQARCISAQIAGVRVICVYVINGQTVGAPAYEAKLAWLDGLTRWVPAAHQANQPLIMVGDFNIAPQDEDTYDPNLWHGRIFCSEPERERFNRLIQWGLIDLHREQLRRDPSGIRFTWWDYRAGSFHRNWGLRIDLLLATSVLAAKCQSVTVDREERREKSGPGKPSDHAPVIATFS